MIYRFRSSRRHTGFTLVELLVVVAVIALLIGVLLPALAGARAAGFQMKGAANQKQLVLGVVRWSSDNNLDIPGLNTSGRSLEDLDDSDPQKRLSRSGDRPTQNWDWVSPAIGTDSLPESRAERFIRIWEEYGDPAASDTITTDGVKNANTDLTDALNRAGGMPVPSILMPGSWQWAGRQPGGNRVYQPLEEEDVAKLPQNWFPRITNIGSESRKVAIADGYANLNTPEVDGDIWANPTLVNSYGAFGSSSPIKAASINYDQTNIDVARAYRHRDKMNAAFWDGHVETLTIRDSQNPSYWYPKGTIMGNSGSTTATSREFVKANDTIN